MKRKGFWPDDPLDPADSRCRNSMPVRGYPIQLSAPPMPPYRAAGRSAITPIRRSTSRRLLPRGKLSRVPRADEWQGGHVAGRELHRTIRGEGGCTESSAAHFVAVRTETRRGGALVRGSTHAQPRSAAPAVPGTHRHTVPGGQLANPSRQRWARPYRAHVPPRQARPVRAGVRVAPPEPFAPGRG